VAGGASASLIGGGMEALGKFMQLKVQEGTGATLGTAAGEGVSKVLENKGVPAPLANYAGDQVGDIIKGRFNEEDKINKK